MGCGAIVGAAGRRRRLLIVDGANVVGSRPDGWWRDRAGAAARLHSRLVAADLGYAEIILVLEGGARAGVPVGVWGAVRTVHAPADGDQTIAATAAERVGEGCDVVVVTADRALGDRVIAAGARVTGPGRLLDALGG